MPRKAISRKHPLQLTTFQLIAVGVAAVAFWTTGIVLGKELVRMRALIEATKHWPTTRGVIVEAGKVQLQLPERRTKNPPSARVTVRYRYTVNGTQYTGERYNLGNVLPVGHPQVGAPKDWLEGGPRFMPSYPRGKAVSVHYDPQDPSQSILAPRDQSTRGLDVMVAAFLLFAIASTAAFVLALRHRRRGRT